MSGSDKDDEITVVASHSGEYASSEPGSSPQRIKTGKPRLTEAEILWREAIQHYNVDPIVYLKTPQQQKRQIIKKSLFSSSQDDISMPTPAQPIKELSDEDFAEEQIHLIPKLPGQTTDDINIPTREHFEYAYRNFTDPKVRKYLSEIQQWLYFIRYHNKPDCSIPILDHTGKPYTEVTNWTLQDIDALPANATKLREIQVPKHKQLISVPTDTGKTTKTSKSTTSQTVKDTSTPQPVPVSHTLAKAIQKDTGASSTPPPSPPTPHRNTPTTSPHTSPSKMPSLRDRAVFFPQTTFDGKDKTKTRTHLQSFEDFVDRQKLDPEKDFKEIQEYFLMTLRDLARQWFTSTKFASYDELKKKFTQEYSEYGKTPRDWLKSWTELRFRADTDNIDEYIQKFQELATLLAYPEEHQVQIFKMMMPENIELRIKDMTTLADCIEEAKVCLSICQPSSLISRMSTLTVAPSETETPVRQRSPSPIRRNQSNNNSQNRQSRQRQRPPILKRSTFQGFRQYPGNNRPRSVSNPRNNFPNSRFRSTSRSLSRPRFGNFNQSIECYYCHRMGHTANNCFRRQNRNVPRRQPNQVKRGNYRNFKRYPNYTNYRSDSRYRNFNTPQRRVNFSEPPMYSDLQTGNQR